MLVSVEVGKFLEVNICDGVLPRTLRSKRFRSGAANRLASNPWVGSGTFPCSGFIARIMWPRSQMSQAAARALATS